MTNSTLENKIRLLNDNKLPIKFKTQINSRVLFVIDPDGYEYWFHGSKDIYTCVVLNMYPNDLHVLTLPEYQGKGFMTYALKELKPLIEMKWEDSIKCTVDSKVAERVAEKVGIHSTRNEHFEDNNVNFFKHD